MAEVDIRAAPAEGHGGGGAGPSTPANDSLSPTVSEDDIHAYVDGCLEPERRAEVERILQKDPEAAAKAVAYRRQAESLRRQFDPILEEPIPEHLLAILRPDPDT